MTSLANREKDGQVSPLIEGPHLLIRNGTQTQVGLDFARLQAKPLLLGRQSDCDVVLTHQQGVSRKHATLSYRADDQRLILTDLGSANGTTLNGQFIAGPTPLLPGDRIGLGTAELIFVTPNMPQLAPGQVEYREDSEPGIARLEIVSSGIAAFASGAFCRLTPSHPFLIGRHQTNDLKLVEPDEQQTLMISRRHLGIIQEGGRYFLRDMGATNPALLNERPLGPSQMLPLKEGDTIRIGSTLLRFRAPRMPLASVSSPDATKVNPGSRAVGPATLRFTSPRWQLRAGPGLLALPTERPLRIGRAKDSDLRLDDPSISRNHARLIFGAGHFRLSDAGSTNGTLVNGKTLTAPAFLEPGDRVKLGEFEFVFEAGDKGQGLETGEKPVLLDKPVTLKLAFEAKDLNALPADEEEQTVSRLVGRQDNFDILATRPATQPNLAKKAAPEPELDIIFDELGTETLADWLARQGEGETLTMGGNQPFLLDDPESCWLVRTGKVEIFTVQVKQGQPANARHHVCSILPGQVFFGTDSNWYGEGLSLLAAASVNTELLQLPVERLRRAAKRAGLSALVGQALDEWLASLAANLTRDVLVPRTNLSLDWNEESVTLPAGQKAGPKRGRAGLWVNFATGQNLFLSEEEFTPASDEVLFPLYGNTWIQALEDSRLATFPTKQVIGQAGTWEGLELFYELFFRVKFTNIRLAAYDEINRLRQKNEHDLAVSHSALAELSAILEDDEGTASVGGSGEKEDALFIACKLVGQAQGLTMQNAPAKEGQNEQRNPLEEIARSSRVRTRAVTLEPEWWRKDNGPLLGFLRSEEDGSQQAVALLPLSKGGYKIVDPASSDPQLKKVDVAVANQLETTAYVFYRPFPEKSLKARDLLMFGLRGSRKDLLTTLFMGIAGGLLGLAVPLLTGYLFDAVIPSGQSGLLWQMLVALVVVSLAGTAFQITRSIAILRIETRLEVSVQSALWDRLLNLPTTFFRQYSAGDLASRAMGIDTIQHVISSSVITAILGSVFSLFSFFLLFTYDLRLALLALLLTGIVLVVIIVTNWRQLDHQRKQAEQQGKIAGLVLQLIGGIAKLRVTGGEVRAFAVWVKEFAEQRRLTFKVRSSGNRLRVFTAVWPVITFLVIFGAIGALKDQNLSTGMFLAFLAAFGQFSNAMLEMAVAFISVASALPIYERAKSILETVPEVSTAKADPGELSGAIEINHLSFRYQPDTPVILDDISLKIKPGQFVALVGPSGSGKSSLFRLLLGFEAPSSGSIYYDNQDLAGLDVSAVRRQLGVVIQNGKLMPGDILSNITGAGQFSLDEAWEAARKAGVEADIQAMPMGMFTVVSEGGATLSGGQRQRLMIARAIIAKPRILLFDEATSALDNQTQAIVSRSLESLQATRIVIAHRLSTIVNADYIYVLQGGKIAQAGTYQELINQSGPFQELATRQLA